MDFHSFGQQHHPPQSRRHSGNSSAWHRQRVPLLMQDALWRNAMICGSLCGKFEFRKSTNQTGGKFQAKIGIKIRSWDFREPRAVISSTSMVIYPCKNGFNEPKKEAATNSTKPPEIRERTWKNQQIEGAPEQDRTNRILFLGARKRHLYPTTRCLRCLPNSDLRWLVVEPPPWKMMEFVNGKDYPIDEMEK